MKDQLPSPDFDGNQYARPNQQWICGHSREGKQCRIGPDSSGNCRAKFECQPVLETKPGETKGRYRCTRTADQGGPCDSGPVPDGTCSRRITPCQPLRTVRARRAVWIKGFSFLVIGCLTLLFCGKQRWQFISPGELSSPHTSQLFHRRSLASGLGEENCAACHRAATGGPSYWVEAAFSSDPNPVAFHALLVKREPRLTKIDQSCQQCHSGHNFHQQNVPWNYSCSECHQEHKGGGPMKSVRSENCAFCHSNASLMPPTRTLHAFDVDHPEFRFIRDRMTDPDTLRFSHKTHQASNPKMVQMTGQNLTCQFCHKPSGTGEYYERVSFARNCQICHSLQFDKRNPDLVVPHGSADFVHAFLRSLPTQYADYGRRVKNIRQEDELQRFVQGEVSQLRAQYGSGEELEEKVFFSAEDSAPTADVARLGAQGRALFPGCAYCHEVRRTASVPAITAPIIPARWLTRGKFDHTRHTNFHCGECHKVSESTRAADILLPSQKTCAACHSPKGGGRNDCAACHWYHNDEKASRQTSARMRH
jgi:hypothetical protein